MSMTMITINDRVAKCIAIKDESRECDILSMTKMTLEIFSKLIAAEIGGNELFMTKDHVLVGQMNSKIFAHKYFFLRLSLRRILILLLAYISLPS